MNKFAKIFEIDDYQILIMKDIDIDDDGYDVVQMMHLDDVTPRMSLGFSTEAKRDECFDEYSEIQAKHFLNVILEMLKK